MDFICELFGHNIFLMNQCNCSVTTAIVSQQCFLQKYVLIALAPVNMQAALKLDRK